MASLKCILLFLLPFSFVVSGRVARTPRVVLSLKTGGVRTGEILLVRDQRLVFSPGYGLSDDHLKENTGLLTVIRTDDIRLILLPGRPRIAEGIGAGGAMGCVAGAMIGYARPASSGNGTLGLGGCEEVSNGVAGCIIGGGAGMGIGGIVGASVSVKDSVISGEAVQDVNVLKRLARYRDEEPEFLRSVLNAGK